MSKQGEKPRILHIDDNEDFLEIFAHIFSDNFDITSTTKINSALTLLNQKSFDTLITDYELEETNGIELMRQVHLQLPGFPVLFFTGQGSEEIARQTFISGAHDYFTKDLNSFAYREKIENSINQAIEKYATQKALERESNINNVLANLSVKLIKPSTPEKASSLIFKAAMELTESTTGLTGYIKKSKNTYHFFPSSCSFCQVMTGSSPEISCCQCETVQKIWEWSIQNNEKFYTNTPDKHPSLSPILDILPDIRSFLNYPSTTEQQFLCLITLANSPRGYTQEDLDIITRLSSLYTLVIQRNEVETELLDNWWRFYQIFQKASDPMFLHSFDKSGKPEKFLEVNDAACRHLKYSRDELLSKTPLDIDCNDTSRNMKNVWHIYKSTGSAVFDSVHVTKEGQRVPVEVTFHGFMLDGKNVTIAIARDITQRVEHEKKIIERIDFLQTLIDAIPIPIFFKDVNFRYIGCNKSCANVFGLSSEQILGKTLRELAPGEMAESFLAIDREILKTSSTHVMEIQKNIFDGSYRDYIFVKSPFYGPTGETAGIASAAVDITDLRNIERKLQRINKAFLMMGADRANNINTLITTCGELLSPTLISYTSVQCESPVIIGSWIPEQKFQDQITTQPVEDLILKQLKTIDFSEYLDPHKKATFLNMPFEHDSSQDTLIIRPIPRSGVIFSCLSLVFPGTISLKENDCMILDILATAIGIEEERKYAEDARIITEKKFRTIFEEGVLGIFQSTFDGSFITLNPAAAGIFGYDNPDEMIREITDISGQLYVNPEDRRKTLAMIRESPGLVTREILLRRKDNSIFTGRLNCRVVTDDDGNPLYMEGFIEDISDWKKLEAELTSKSYEMENLTSFISYNLRSSLSHLRSLLDQLQNNTQSPGDVKELSIQETDQILTFVDKLLQFSNSGKMCDNRSLVDLDQLIRKVYNLNKYRHQPSELIIEKNLPKVTGDPTSIELLFNSLIENSFRYRDPDKSSVRIAVTGSQKDNSILISFRDNGIGIPPEYAIRVFIPGISIGAQGGPGFGLAIAKRIVNSYGGDIRIEGTNSGKGVTFQISLPQSHSY